MKPPKTQRRSAFGANKIAWKTKTLKHCYLNSNTCRYHVRRTDMFWQPARVYLLSFIHSHSPQQKRLKPEKSIKQIAKSAQKRNKMQNSKRKKNDEIENCKLEYFRRKIITSVCMKYFRFIFGMHFYILCRSLTVCMCAILARVCVWV